MNYKILTDSCCDFPSGMYEQLDLAMVPLSVEFQGKVYDDKNDDSLKELYSGLQGKVYDDKNDDSLKELYSGLRCGDAAKTSAVNPARWGTAMEAILYQGMDVLVLAFSSGLSTTYQSAVIAAEELREKYPQRKILVVDTLAASMGQGLLVWYACKKRDEGLSMEEVYQWVEDNKLHLCHWFTVDDLMHLKRGGRVSATTALVGTMLQIKPVLHVDDEGHLISMAKARGRKASLDALAKKVAELGGGYDNSTMFISHGDCLEDAQYLAQLLKSRYGAKEVIISYVGSVIGSHAGPGTVALFFLGDHR